MCLVYYETSMNIFFIDKGCRVIGSPIWSATGLSGLGRQDTGVLSPGWCWALGQPWDTTLGGGEVQYEAGDRWSWSSVLWRGWVVWFSGSQFRNIWKPQKS